MDDRGLLYVHEAVIIVTMIIAAVYFVTVYTPGPVVSTVSRTHQLQTLVDDALIVVNELRILETCTIEALRDEEPFTKNNELIQKFDKLLPSNVDYKIIIDQETYYESYDTVADLSHTVNSHYIVVDYYNADAYDFQILAWYRYNL